ncbi:MAG: PAS domain-containing protein, partial [Candidatus Anammoxibacter sp.]
MKLNNQISKELRSELKLLRRQNSKLKHKEEELTQQAAFQKNNPAPLIRTRYDGTILNVNPAGIKIFGKRVIGSSVFSILT